jgi:hypothetical protein
MTEDEYLENLYKTRKNEAITLIVCRNFNYACYLCRKFAELIHKNEQFELKKFEIILKNNQARFSFISADKGYNVIGIKRENIIHCYL